MTLRWSQSGFAAIGDRMETPRNLFGFKDGTANPSKEKDFDRVIWADSKDWMENGSYMAVRRIQMFLETWDRTSLEEQENTFGRYKESGAPFGKKNEFDEVDLSLLPDDSHVRLVKVEKPLLRRSYSYSDGIDEKTGQFDTGLLFISFQKDPDNFVKVQTNLGATDKMNEYITHIGSGIFACFGGVEKGATLVRNYWKAKSWLLVLALSLLIHSPVGAQESLSSYFVKITDASKEVKNGNQSGYQESR